MRNRRGLGVVLLVVVGMLLLPMGPEAREGSSAWDGESKAECLMMIIDMLKLEQDERLVWNESSYHEWYGLCRSNFSALLAMGNLLEVDTVYWFSDFQDETNPRLRKVLARILAEKKVKLYLHSQDKRPHVDLVKYARSSGGDYQREKIKLDE